VSKLKRLLCYESQHQSQSNEKSLVQFDYEKAVSNYLGTQSTFNLECVRIPVIYRVNQVEYIIRMHEAAPQEYVNTYLKHRTTRPWLLLIGSAFTRAQALPG